MAGVIRPFLLFGLADILPYIVVRLHKIASN